MVGRFGWRPAIRPGIRCSGKAALEEGLKKTAIDDELRLCTCRVDNAKLFGSLRRGCAKIALKRGPQIVILIG
jgi:hypothetical protein